MDTEERTITRRRMLRASSAAGAVAIAGCSGSSENDSGAENDSESLNETDGESESDGKEEVPELPNVESRIIQRDKAAITNVRHVVEGTMTWPSAEWIDTVDQALLGTWETTDGVIDFYDSRKFEMTGSGYSYSGGYATRNGYLFLEFDSGASRQWQYEVRSDSSPPVLELTAKNGDSSRYRLTERRSDQRNPVEVFDSLIVVRKENGTTKSETARSGAVGSGFIVSPDGAVVTNAHVVGAHRDPNRTVYEEYMRSESETIRKELSSNWDLSDEQRQKAGEILYEKVTGYYEEHGTLRNVSESVTVLNGKAATDDDREVESWAADVETTGTVYKESSGEPSMGRDVAILDIDGENLPTVTLGSASDLSTGESLYVVGYPDIGIDQLFDDTNTTVEPTMTTGIVSARRELNTGIDSIQTDAAINSGNSGGPMYNSDGEVVGVATFSPPNVDIQDIQFGLPIEIANGFLNEVGVENTTGEMQSAYEAGLEAYWRGDCETATERMETVLELYPDHPQAQDYITDCENGEAPGQK